MPLLRLCISSQCRTNFSHWRTDQWQVFGWYWSKFNRCSLQPKFQPIWHPSKWADGQLIPSWGFIQKTLQLQGKFFTSSFLQASVAGPILGIDFLRKFKITVVTEINQIQFASTAVASPAPYLPSAVSPTSYLLSAASSDSSSLPTSTSVPAPVKKMPAAMTSSQPPAISAHVVWNPEVKSSSFSSRENQSLLDPPPSLQKIPVLSLLT